MKTQSFKKKEKKKKGKKIKSTEIETQGRIQAAFSIQTLTTLCCLAAQSFLIYAADTQFNVSFFWM